MEALRFGVGVDSRGYNLFVSGATGSGRTSMVRTFLEQIAARGPDTFYVGPNAQAIAATVSGAAPASIPSASFSKRSVWETSSRQPTA